MDRKVKRWESGAAKLKSKQERDRKSALLRQSIQTISTFFTPSSKASTSSNVSEEPEPGAAGGEDENANVIHASDREEAAAASSSGSPDGPPHRVASTEAENCSPVTATCSSAVTPASPHPSPDTNEADRDHDSRDPPVLIADINSATPLQPEHENQEWLNNVTDPALWEDTSSDRIKSVLIERGAAVFQNRRSNYPASARDRTIGGKNRYFNNDLRSCCLPNGQTVTREWIMYSPSNGNIYCFACKLFSNKCHQFVEGFSDWKHSERIGEHERSDEHRSCMLSLHQRCKGTATIDSSLIKQMEGARQYWREVLKRVVAVIKFLGERGLAFRGDNELLGSPQNGNFLGIIELLAQFDPFLAGHIEKYGQKGRGNVSYLSSTICDEFIDVMGEKTRQTIAEEIREAKYFSVVVDSTPDLSHVDQLTFIFRFVNKEGKIVERFLAFEPIESHTGESLAECVVAMVDSLGLELSNCRGQSYDNASNMSGKYNGLQAHLKKINPLIHYVPCAAHSLNLVGVNTIEASSPEVGNYFDTLQSLYNFCASSTSRWGKVFRKTGGISLTLKSLSATRWSSRAESTKALSVNYSNIKEALTKIAGSDDEKRDTRNEAGALCAKLEYLETAFMAHFWNAILDRFQATSAMLQKSDINILTAVNLLQSLRAFVSSQRDQFDVYEKAALNVTGVLQTYKRDLQRSRKCKTFADEGGADDVSSLRDGRNQFKVETFYVIIDKLVSCLDHRLSAYKDLTDIFGVLFQPETTSNSEIIKHANALVGAYTSDLNSGFANELLQFRSFMSAEKDKSPSKMLNTMLELGLQPAFPNVYVALRMFLTLPVTNCEGERSFSHLARIKNELRTTMSQQRLKSLSLLAIESELVRDIDFNDVVEEFTRRKARKKTIA